MIKVQVCRRRKSAALKTLTAFPVVFSAFYRVPVSFRMPRLTSSCALPEKPSCQNRLFPPSNRHYRFATGFLSVSGCFAYCGSFKLQADWKAYPHFHSPCSYRDLLEDYSGCRFHRLRPSASRFPLYPSLSRGQSA